ncbi:hypothetical protein ES705_28641 [subsurface metagenome]
MADEIELTGDELLIAIKESGLSKSFQAYIQKYSDQKVSEGIKTREKNIQAKNLTDSEKIANLETELAQMKNDTAKNSLNNSIKKALKEADLSEGFLKYIKVDDLDDQSKITEAVKNLKDDLLDAKQAEIDQKLKEGDIPLKGESTFTGSGMETEAKDYAKKISAEETSNNKE